MRNWILTLAFSLIFSTATVASAQSTLIANNTPSFVTGAKSLGPANPSEIIDVSIWLNLHDRTVMDSLAAELYDPTSSN